LQTHAKIPTTFLSRRRLQIAGIVAVLALLLVAPRVAAAQDQAAIDKIAKLNKKAVDEYENLNFDESRKLLQNALDLCAQAGLDKHDVTARTYIHLGVVMFAGFKQKTDAIKYFRRALAIQPDIKLDKSLANPEVQDVFDQAITEQKNESGGGGGGETTGGAAIPATDAILHTPVMRATQGKPIPIKVVVAAGLGATKVILSFTTDGSEDFGEREMKEDPAVDGGWVGEIPASATGGATVGYYIEAQGEGDKTLATKGSDRTPMRIKLVGPGGAPVAAKKKAAPKAGDYSTWMVGLAIGGGVGYATGKGEVNTLDELKPAGFAAARLLQISPEVGYFLGPDVMLSVQLRIQIVTGGTSYYDEPNGTTDCGTSGVCKPATYALAGLARLLWFINEAELRPYIGAVAGLGQIRHVATFNSVDNCGELGDKTCVDTIAAGPVLFGGATGFFYEVAPGFSLTLGTNILLAVPHFTFHFDFNAGVAYEF
jgi:hypothetical protein